MPLLEVPLFAPVPVDAFLQDDDVFGWAAFHFFAGAIFLVRLSAFTEYSSLEAEDRLSVSEKAVNLAGRLARTYADHLPA